MADDYLPGGVEATPPPLPLLGLTDKINFQANETFFHAFLGTSHKYFESAWKNTQKFAKTKLQEYTMEERRKETF